MLLALGNGRVGWCAVGCHVDSPGGRNEAMGWAFHLLGKTACSAVSVMKSCNDLEYLERFSVSICNFFLKTDIRFVLFHHLTAKIEQITPHGRSVQGGKLFYFD